MFKVKNELELNHIADIFNINEENTDSNRERRRMQIVLPRFKTVAYMEDKL